MLLRGFASSGWASSGWAWEGWTGEGWTGEGWTGDLARDYRVVRIDQLGHGLTKIAPGGSVWGSDQGEFLEATLALGLGDVILAGNSMGGGVAWSFAARHRDRVRALILVDAAGPSPVRPPLRARAMLARWYAPALRLAFRWTGGTLVMGAAMRSGGGNPSFVRRVDVQRSDAFWRRHRDELLNAMQTARVVAAPARLSDIRAPTLVLRGGRDRLVPRATADALVSGINGARLIVYPGLGHTPHKEDPVETVADARAFLHALS